MGMFTVIQKDRHHVSNLYNASMPYMQRITWSGSALHQGPLPGYPASHGCVRLTESFAQLLWKTTKMGARIIITRPEVTPLEFAHARLFVPKPKMVAAPPPAEPVPAPGAVQPQMPVPVPLSRRHRLSFAPRASEIAEPATTPSSTRSGPRTQPTPPPSRLNPCPRCHQACHNVSRDQAVASSAAEQPTKGSDTDGVGQAEAAEGRAEANPAEPNRLKPG